MTVAETIELLRRFPQSASVLGTGITIVCTDKAYRNESGRIVRTWRFDEPDLPDWSTPITFNDQIKEDSA